MPAGSGCGLFHVDRTHAVHGEAVTYLFDLFIDLDFLRIGRPPRAAVTCDRLDRWPAIAARVRQCGPFSLPATDHEPELGHAEDFIAWVRGELVAGRVPILAPGEFAAFKPALARFERCRESNIKY